MIFVFPRTGRRGGVGGCGANGGPVIEQSDFSFIHVM